MNKNIETTREAKLEATAENQVDKIKDEFNNLPVKDQEEIVGSNHILMQSLEVSRYFSGPLPHPSILAEYNKAVPDAAERILRMAEKQQEASIKNQTYQLQKTAESSKRGQYMGFIVALLCLICSFVLLFMGKAVTGLVTMGASAVAVMAAIGSANNKNNSEKQKSKTEEKNSPES